MHKEKKVNVRKEAPDKGPVPAYLLDRYCLFLCVCVCVFVFVCLNIKLTIH